MDSTRQPSPGVSNNFGRHILADCLTLGTFCPTGFSSFRVANFDVIFDVTVIFVKFTAIHVLHLCPVTHDFQYY